MEKTDLEVNKIKFQNRSYHKLQNYYPRPTYPDIQTKERGKFVQNSFTTYVRHLWMEFRQSKQTRYTRFNLSNVNGCHDLQN